MISLSWGELGSFPPWATQVIFPFEIGSLILNDNVVELTGVFKVGLIIKNSGGVTSKVTFFNVSDVETFVARSVPLIYIW